jgi:hypothetical protein
VRLIKLEKLDIGLGRRTRLISRSCAFGRPLAGIIGAMPQEPMPVESRLLLGKAIPEEFRTFELGPYRLIVADSSNNELALMFNTNVLSGHNHREEETVIIGPIVGSIAEYKNPTLWDCGSTGSRIPSFDPERRGDYPDFHGIADPANLQRLGPRLFGFPEDLGRQFIRAARAYASALDVIAEDHTFAFFLLVVAIECLSSQDGVIPHVELHPEGKTCERFCEFIRRYLPEAVRSDDERNASLLTELLKTAYYAHRSAFVHGGKEVSGAAVMADQIRSSYVKHSTDGPEVKTPGVAWFASVVRYSLLGFLGAFPPSPHDVTLLARIAAEQGRLKLKPKQNVTAGDVLGVEDDIDYR